MQLIKKEFSEKQEIASKEKNYNKIKKLALK